VAINDVLPLKATRRDATANLKWFWGSRDTSDLMSMVSFTFTMRRRHIRLASAPLTNSRLAKFGWVPFAVCNTWQRSRTQNLRTEGENSGPILSRLWTEVRRSLRNFQAMYIGDPSHFPTPLPDCLCHVIYLGQNLRHFAPCKKGRMSVDILWASPAATLVL